MVTVKEQLEGYRQVIKDLPPEKFDAQLLIDIKNYIFSIRELKAAFQENLQKYEKINNSTECNKIRLEFNEHIYNDDRLKHLNTEDKLPINCIREIFQNICNAPKFSQCHSIKELFYSYNEDVNTAKYLKKELWQWLIHSKISNIDCKLCNQISNKMDKFFSLFDDNCLNFAVIGLDKCNSFKNKNITLILVATYNVLMELECIVVGNTSTDIKEPKLTLSGIIKKENNNFGGGVYNYFSAGFELVEREPGVSYTGPPVLLLPETKEDEKANKNKKNKVHILYYSEKDNGFTLDGKPFMLTPKEIQELIWIKKYEYKIAERVQKGEPVKLENLRKVHINNINNKAVSLIGTRIIELRTYRIKAIIKGIANLN